MISEGACNLIFMCRYGMMFMFLGEKYKNHLDQGENNEQLLQDYCSGYICYYSSLF